MSSPESFGRFEVRPEQRAVLVDGAPAMMGARAFDVLLALMERRNRTVTKSELLDLVWPGLFVEENNLQVQVSTLRKLLGPSVIATIPGRGYRFTATIEPEQADNAGHTETEAPVAAGGAVAPATRTNLPRTLPTLYGRAVELADLHTLVQTNHLVTVVGPGGIGKSMLSQAVAHGLADRWPDGAWMVELAGLSDGSLVPNAVAQVLDIKIGSESAFSAVVEGVATRAALLVLDNCEHLLDAVATLVDAILRRAPSVSVMCTSQEPLHLADEQQYRLNPLAVPSVASTGALECGAMALFVARVRAVDARFVLDDINIALAVEICRRLDGLPLAIELAAARVPALGLRALRDKLDARLRLLTVDRPRRTAFRHQTLRAALDWSHNLLDEKERLVFRRLGVFVGGFTAELAQAVAIGAEIDAWAALDHLGALVDKSLVVVDGDEPPRYCLLESTRAFALEQFSECERADSIRLHALAMRDFLRRVDDDNLDGELRTDEYANRALPELDNLRAAYAWANGSGGDVRVAISLAAHAGSLIDYAAECADWLLPHKHQVETDVADVATTARYWRAMAAVNMGSRVERGVQVDAANRAQSLYRQLGQPRRVFSSLIQLSRRLQAHQHGRAVQDCLEEARSLLQSDWPLPLRIALVSAEALAARREDRLDVALASYREAVSLSQAAGDWRVEVIQRNNLIDILWSIGPLDESARAACRLAEDLRARPGGDDDIAVVLANVVGIFCEMGRLADAGKAALEALPHMRRAQKCYLEEWIYLFWRCGQSERATQLLGAFNAELLRTGEQIQPNEARLLAEARVALQSELPPEVFACALATGPALRVTQLFHVISEGLTCWLGPGANTPQSQQTA